MSKENILKKREQTCIRPLKSYYQVPQPESVYFTSIFVHSKTVIKWNKDMTRKRVSKWNINL